MLSSRLFRIVLGAGLGAAIAAYFCFVSSEARAAAAPTKAIEVQLDGDVKVAGDQVVLGDVATIYAKDLSNFKALAGLVLSRIPDDKQEVRLPAGYVRARILGALPPGSEFALRSPDEITFRLQRLGISAQELAGEITRQAKAAGKFPSGTEIEVVPTGGLEQLKGLTMANVRIEPQAEMQQWKGDLSFKVIRNEGNPAPLWVKTRVRWFSPAWTAARTLAFNEQPAPSSFTLGRVETTGLREEPVTGSPEELAALLQGSKLRRALPANAPLVASALERRPDAASGSMLRVVFVSESGVRVSADGQLVGSGSIGGDVRARLKSSKKLVTGKLVSQGLVEVNL